VGLSILIFLLTYVVPMVTRIFDRMNQKLPLPTQILLSVADFFSNYLIIVAIVLGLAIFAFSRWVKRDPRGRQFWDRLVLRSPIFGNLYQMMLIGRFARILSTLLRSGVHMLQSLVVVSSTMKNKVVSDAVVEMSKMVEGGADLSAALRGTGVFPAYVADMVSVGESSGNLEEMLTSVSDYYETNANQKIAVLTSMMEPLIIVALAVVVAFVLVSIMLPLFEMNRVLAK
jgi:general secretion pathway protein F